MQTNSDKLNALKEQLSKELKKPISDNNLIIQLSNEITALDENEIRFTVDAGLINRLGKELVGRHETAVSELVKNAYDADALSVKLIFDDAYVPGGTLLIEDNGVGMTRDQLINGFMRLSSSQKIHNPKSDRYKRMRAGKKGIGRFATQRLGTKLTIITQTMDAVQAIKITIEWDQFETDRNLQSVANQIENVPKVKSEGTNLIIEGLREGWSDTMIKRVFRYTADLLQPYPLSKQKIEEKEKEKSKIEQGEVISDPGFKGEYFRLLAGEEIAIIDEDVAIFSHALAEIEGYVLDDGQGCWALKSDRLNFPQEVFLIGNDDKDRDAVTAPFNLIRGIHFKTYYFIYEGSLFSPGNMTFIKNLAYEKGGIRLYRNGFRVLPYGEAGNDWLGLDKSSTRGMILGPHQNISFFGFVEIEDQDGYKFEETSSREGLIENEYLNELVSFIYRSIVSSVQKVSELRGRKATASQKNFKPKEKTPSEKVDEAVDKLVTFVKEENIINDEPLLTGELFKNAINDFKQARQEEKQQNLKEKIELIEEINMLRILAGLGLVIGEFVHEVQRFLPGFDAEIKYLKRVVADNKQALERVNLLENNIKAFTAYTSYFDKSISRNVVRELENIELRDVIKDFYKVIENDLKRSGMTLTLDYDGFNLFTVPMHPSEWASILFNLYTNSKKAIIRSKNPGRINIRSGKVENIVYMEFSDNGDGIPEENQDRVFNAFFTTTSAANHSANDAESVVGTGLGLKILKDIIEAYGGEIFIADKKRDYNTTIRVEIPQKTTENE